MLSFLAIGFAVAGTIAATGPILIHLLNRRRHRTVHWAAMDFLREAMQRNRKVLQLRDLLLLLLRIFCVLLFGLALARPFLTAGWQSLSGLLLVTLVAGLIAVAALAGTVVASGKWRWTAAGVFLLAALGCGLGARSVATAAGSGMAEVPSDHEPVHAVLVLDNSMSMGCQSLGGTRLDEARSRARAFLDDLPAESRITIIPLCGSMAEWSLDAFRTREDARDALDRIEVVDRAGSAARAVELAARACRQVPEMTARRVVFLGDQQLETWQAAIDPAALEQLPELQVVQVGSDVPANLAVLDLSLRDGVADVETPASFLARIRYDGDLPVEAAQVTLNVEGSPVASQTVSLEPGQERELEFRWQFDASVEPGRPAFVPVSLAVRTDSSREDSLPRDNRRQLAVPVVAGVPVVFVDQLGADGELPQQNLYGETARLRRWLAPRQRGEGRQGQLIRIRHLTMDQVDINSLQDARLVVVAGVPAPGAAVETLREYLLQGGQLLIAAGGDLDASRWNEDAWQDGHGILPAPLDSEPVGQSLEETAATAALNPFQLDVRTLEHEWFLIEGSSREELVDLYRTPLFFKAVRVRSPEEFSAELLEARRSQIAEERAFVVAARKRALQWEQLQQQGLLGETEQAQQAADLRRLRELNPRWWLWRDPAASAEQTRPVEDVARDSLPAVLASWEQNQLPFLVERRIGRGRVVFVATGVHTGWNAGLTDSAAIVMFDRMLRGMLRSTLTPRNYDVGPTIVLPVDRSEELEYRLRRPPVEAVDTAGLVRDSSEMAAADASPGETEPDAGAEAAVSADVRPASTVPEAGREILPVEATGDDSFGIRIRNPLIAGHYVLTAHAADAAGEAGTEDDSGGQVRKQVLALNPPAGESDMRTLTADALFERLGPGNWRWIADGEAIRLEGAAVHGRDMWKSLIRLVLACLLLEMVLLSRSSWKRRSPEGTSAAAGAGLPGGEVQP